MHLVSRIVRVHTAAVIAAVLITASPHDARAQPARARRVTPADIARLEKKIEDQQRLLEAMIALHQQYLRHLVALLPAGDAASGRDPRPEPATGPVVTAPVTPVAAVPAPTASPGPAPLAPGAAPAVAVATTRPEPARPVATTRPEPARPVAPPRTDPRPGDPRIVAGRPRVEGKATALGSVVGKVSGAGDAYVYIESIAAAPVARSAMMKQEGKQFLPRVLVVQKGAQVAFPNLDTVFHNVFSVTPDHSFDLGSYRQGDSRSVTMSRPGLVSVYCNMHPQMVGYILVVPNRHYVAAGRDGFFRLSDVPVGKHRVVAWAPNAKPVAVEVEVVESESVTTEFALTKSRPGPHANKEGLPYGSYNE